MLLIRLIVEALTGELLADTEAVSVAGVATGTVLATAAVAAAWVAGAAGSACPKVTSNDQRARDADARAILEAELRKAQARQAELSKEYNNGAPDRTIQERTNPLLYTRRVDELKEALARTESDIAGIQREISRLPQVAP